MALRQKTTVRIFILVLLLAGLLAGANAALNGSEETDPQKAIPNQRLPVQALSLQEVDSHSQTVQYTGMIVAGNACDLAFNRAGRITEISIDEGDLVDETTVIAKLDTRDLDAQQKQLLSQKAEAIARLERLKNGPRQETVKASKARVRQLESQLKLQEATLQRRKSLLSSNAVSKEQFDESRFGSLATAAQLEEAEQQLADLEKGSREEDIAAQQAVVKQFDAAIEALEVQFEDSELSSSFAGSVAKRMVDIGAVVSIGQPVVRIVGSRHREANIGVPSIVARELSSKVGTQFTIVVSGEPWNATLRAVLPELDVTTRTQTAVFVVKPNEAGGLPVASEIARIGIERSIDESGFWVPTDALQRGQRGLWSIFVINSSGNKPATVQRRDVSILSSRADTALVRGTIVQGEKVVAGGTHRLVDGQQVDLVQDQP